LYFSLFTFHSSLFSKSPARLFQRRDKREERKEKVAFFSLGQKALIFIWKYDIMFLKRGEDNE